MNRSPKFHEKSESHRIVSFPNGQWHAQQLFGGKGVNHVPPVKEKGKIVKAEVPHWDPWRPIARPTDFLSAKLQMDASAASAVAAKVIQAA